MVAGCAACEVHIEFFPDIASAVKTLLGHDDEADSWEDRYVASMSMAANIAWGDDKGLEAVAEKVYNNIS